MESRALKQLRSMRCRIIYRGEFSIQDSDAYKQLLSEFFRWISDIQDPIHKDIVMLYYFRGWSYVRIGDYLHYSDAQIKRMKHDIECHNKNTPGD